MQGFRWLLRTECDTRGHPKSSQREPKRTHKDAWAGALTPGAPWAFEHTTMPPVSRWTANWILATAVHSQTLLSKVS